MSPWNLLLTVAGSLWLLAFSLMVWGTWLSRRRFHTPPPHLDAPFALFPVSVIKPLKGVDRELETNLESFFTLDYPDYELLFCIATPNDPARPLVERLMARFPEIRSRLFIGEVVVGPNPKVNNMIRAFDAATHDWTLISDSNVRVERDYLKRLVGHLEPDVGMVTSVVAGHIGRGWGGQLEATYLNTFYARGMNIAEGFGRVCVVGKTMLFQRSMARRFGGLRTLGCYLAEDYMAGEAMQRLGLRVLISSDPVKQMIGDHTFMDFWKRHLRWGRIRKCHGFTAFLLEPWLGAMTSSLLGAMAFHEVLGMPVSLFLILHLGAWAFCDLVVIRAMKVPLQWSTPIFWFAREALALILWFHIASGSTVDWRGRKLAIRAGGVLESVG